MAWAEAQEECAGRRLGRGTDGIRLRRDRLYATDGTYGSERLWPAGSFRSFLPQSLAPLKNILLPRTSGLNHLINCPVTLREKTATERKGHII